MEWPLYSWPTLILLGIGLRIALRVTYGARGPEPNDPIYVLISITSWVLISLGLAPAIFSGILSLVGLIIVLLAAATLIEAVGQRRAAQRRSMCTLLSLMMEYGAQLESSVLLVGQSMRGVVGRAANRLFHALEAGTPLETAIERHPGALPPEARAYLAAGSTSKAQRFAIRELSHSDNSELAVVWRTCVDRVAYLAAVLMVMTVVLTFVMIKLVPEFEKIFAEFDVELPAMTRFAVSMSQFSVQYLAVPLSLAFVAMTLAAIALGILYLCDISALSRLVDVLFTGKRTADVLRIMAVATDERQPLGEVLRGVAAFYPSAVLRGRLVRAATAANAGGDWRDALVHSRIISRAEGALLKTAQPAGNLPWALRAIATRREKRDLYRLATSLQILYPLVILILGVLVGFFVIALFVPIVQLIQGLT
jgi:type II secretory pathway component PulF